MQTLPIFGTDAARPLEGPRADAGTGDLFLAMLKESAARRDGDPLSYRETTRPDEPRRDLDTRIDDRREAPERGEETRRSAADSRDERPYNEEVRRDTAPAREQDAAKDRAPAERDAPAANRETHAEARPKDRTGPDTDTAGTADGAREAKPETPRQGLDEAAATPATAGQATLATPPADGPRPASPLAAQAAPTGGPAAEAAAKAAASLASVPNLVAGEGAPAPGGQAAASPGLTAGERAPAPGTQAAPLAAAVAPAAAGATQAAAIAGQPAARATPQTAPETESLRAAALVSAEARRGHTGAQGASLAGEANPGGTVKTAISGLEGRMTPAAPAGGEPAPAPNPALAAASILGQAAQKPGAPLGAVPRADIALAAATGGTAPAGHADGQLPAQSALQSGPAGPAPMRAPGDIPLAASRPSGPAVPIGEVAVHIHRAAAKGEERIRIQLHPAELGQIDVRLKLGADGMTRALVQVDRPETLELLQRDARGLERALQDAGLKTDSNSLSFSLRDQGQGGPHERDAHAGGLDGNADHAGAREESGAPEEPAAQARPMLSSRALDIHV